MCRIFAHIAVETTHPGDYLARSSCSLLAQSQADKKNRQSDGWGVAYLKNSHFAVKKSPNPIYKETEMLNQAAGSAVAHIVLAHIRAASNPLRLPKHRLIAKEHTQPFGVADFAFCHNGTINIAKAAREQLLGPFKKYLKGRNDSEIYFWLLQKWRSQLKNDTIAAFKETIKELWRLWHALTPKERRPHQAPYTSLNTAASDGQKIYVLCHSLLPQTRRSLCLGTQPFNRMCFRLDGKKQRLVAASEKMSRESGWQILPMHSALTAARRNEKIEYAVEKLNSWKGI